jgi:hypothetical protein
MVKRPAKSTDAWHKRLYNSMHRSEATCSEKRLGPRF